MPYIVRKVTNKECYQVKNKETGKIHAKCTTRKKAESQKRILESLETAGEGIQGDGILGDIYNKILPQREAGKLRPKSRKLMESIAQEQITDLQVIRTPIESYINTVLNTISFGAFKKAVSQLGYDKLFHLSLYINKKYVFHKIEVLTLDYAPSNLIQSNSEVKIVSLQSSNPLTIRDFVEKTRNYMGNTAFTSYDPVNNNCQDLVISTLRANNLLTPDLQSFIKQDAQSIFSKLPAFVSKFAQGVTDVAGRVNRLIEGEGKKKTKKQGGGFYFNIPETTRQYARKI